MAIYLVTGKAYHEKTGGEINLSFHVNADSYLEAKDKGEAEAQRMHPHYVIKYISVQER